MFVSSRVSYSLVAHSRGLISMSWNKPNSIYGFSPWHKIIFVTEQERRMEMHSSIQTPKGMLAFSCSSSVVRQFHQILTPNSRPGSSPSCLKAAGPGWGNRYAAAVTQCSGYSTHGHVCKGCASGSGLGGWQAWLWTLVTELPSWWALDRSFHSAFLSSVSSLTIWS